VPSNTVSIFIAAVASFTALVVDGSPALGESLHGAAPAAREVPARLLPVPTTVSPALQQVIGAPISAFQLYRPRTLDEWRAAIEQADAPAAEAARAAWKQLGVNVAAATIAGVKCYLITPPDVPMANQKRLLVHLHGGAYVFFGGDAGAGEGVLLAHISKMPVISVDYRMPPDHPFPAALDDAIAVWNAVISDHDRTKTALFGTSTGGGLALATVLKLKEQGAPLPGALFLGTPWADLSKTGDTYFANDRVDNALVTYDGLLEEAAKLYAAGQNLKDPLLSPLYGDFAGFPPTILISGTRDLLLSLTVRAHRKLRQADVEAELHVFEGMSHAQYLPSFPAPEAQEALKEVARFFDRHLGR